MSIAIGHLIATLAMVGVILFVQVVHYPLMSRVGSAEFVRYEEGHTSRTSWVVVPLMLVELGTAIWLAFAHPDRNVAYVGLVLLAVIWLSTFALQAPAHRRLSAGFDPDVHRRLVSSNWIRTGAWLARVPVAVGLAM